MIAPHPALPGYATPLLPPKSDSALSQDFLDTPLFPPKSDGPTPCPGYAFVSSEKWLPHSLPWIRLRFLRKVIAHSQGGSLDMPLLPQKSDCPFQGLLGYASASSVKWLPHSQHCLDTPLLPPRITWIRLCFLLKTYLPHSRHCLDTPLLPPKTDSAPSQNYLDTPVSSKKCICPTQSIAWMRLCCITVDPSNYCRHCMNTPLVH